MHFYILKYFANAANISSSFKLDRNDSELINLSLVLLGLHLNVHKTEKMLHFGTKKFSTCERG